jgi:hypothetical protein
MLGDGYTHTTVPALCVSLGLPSPEEVGFKQNE